MPAKAKPQAGFDDVMIEDDELLEVLEKRESMIEAKKEYKRLDRAAKARIDEKKHGVDGPVRIGRFIITQTPDAGGHREFDVTPSVRIGIKKVGD